jgi:hypothetical protein
MIIPILILIVALLVVGLIVLYLYYYPSESETVCAAPEVPKQAPPIVSCNCDDLNGTGHMNRVAHKTRCPRFREVNPELTWKEFMTAEGFSNEPGDWPPVKN